MQIFITLTSLQVLIFRRAIPEEVGSISDVGEGSGEDLSAVNLNVMTTGLQPFSVSLLSPGFQLLTRALMTSKADLGMVPTLMPEINCIAGYSFDSPRLLQTGTNIVFQVQILSRPSAPFGDECDDLRSSAPSVQSPPQPGILKLCITDHEVRDYMYEAPLHGLRGNKFQWIVVWLSGGDLG